MSEYDDGNNGSGGSGGSIISTIISILILAAIWPYLMAIVGLYIAYLAAIAILEWIAQNPLTVVFILLGIFCIYTIFHYRLIPKAWRWMIAPLKPKAVEVHISQYVVNSELPDLASRKFIPSTNLYCYWCTKKLGIQAFELEGKYYCDTCNTKLDVK